MRVLEEQQESLCVQSTVRDADMPAGLQEGGQWPSEGREWHFRFYCE